MSPLLRRREVGLGEGAVRFVTLDEMYAHR